MKSPMTSRFRQAFAQGARGGVIGFAMVSAGLHSLQAGSRQLVRGLCSHRCYPSPSLRSGPSQAGPTLVRGCGAVCAGLLKNCFEIRGVAVESLAITTTTRGSFPCASRLSFSPFSQCRWPAACRTPRRAGWPVPPQARWSLMPLTKTWSRGPHLAALPVPQPAESRSACRRATDILTAYGRAETQHKDHPGRAPGWSFSFRA